jgi:hypothetical protein
LAAGGRAFTANRSRHVTALLDRLIEDISTVESILTTPTTKGSPEELQVWQTLTVLDRRVGAALDELGIAFQVVNPDWWGPVSGAPRTITWRRPRDPTDA